MKTLIVVESLFHNTRAVAEAVADGLGGDVVLSSPSESPPDLDGLDLLLVGGPTHALSMSRERTRADAVSQGGDDPGAGIREWVAAARPSGVRTVTFDTRVRHFPGSAAKSAAKALRAAGFTDVSRGESFWVTGTPGPLADGELERARAWGELVRAG